MTFRATAPRCPACDALFANEESLFETRALRCGACGGVWLDALIETHAEPASRAVSERCPRCERELRSARIASADAWVCLDCRGAFIASTAFGALLEAPRQGTMPPGSEDHVRILAVVRAFARRAPEPSEST